MARGRWGRVAAAALVALGLAPGTFVRTEPVRNQEDRLLILPVETDLPRRSAGFVRTGLWELHSPNTSSGGYSALLALDISLRAFSDRGSRLTFAPPGAVSGREPQIDALWQSYRYGGLFADVESATRDEATGDYWIALENTNAVARYDVASWIKDLARPPAMADWSNNAGAEAMARLADGRFLIFREDAGEVLIFPGDPTGAAPPVRATITGSGGYAIVDAARLPSGKLLLLLRSLSLGFPPFSARLALVDMSALDSGVTERGEALEMEIIADLDTILPRENYEGLAVKPRGDGALTVWIISDNNMAALQRTLLARLVWRP